VHDNFRDLESSKVGQTKLDELAGLVKFVQLRERFLERHTPVCGVQVVDVDAVRAELFEGFIELLLDLLGFVSTGGERVPLGGAGQTTVLPARRLSEGLLLPANVDSGGVDLVVSGTLEAVEDLLVIFEVGDFGTLGYIGTVRGISIRLIVGRSMVTVKTYPKVMVPRMTRGLPVLVMRGILEEDVDVKDRSDEEVAFNGVCCGRWAEIDCSLLNIYIYIYICLDGDTGRNSMSLSVTHRRGDEVDDGMENKWINGDLTHQVVTTPLRDTKPRRHSHARDIFTSALGGKRGRKMRPVLSDATPHAR
jgi:hypothetical protein